MRKPRICILTETYYPIVGGGEVQSRSLAEGLASLGCEVVVLSRRVDAAHPKLERQGLVTIHRLPPVGGERHKKWGLALSSIPALLSIRGRYDVVLSSGFSTLGVPAMLAGRLLGKPCVLKADSQGEMSGAYYDAGLARLGWQSSLPFFRALLLLRNRLFRQADHFVAISTAIAEELLAHGVDRKKIAMVPNGVNTARFYPVAPSSKLELRHKLSIIQKQKIVVFTGRLVSYKGLPLLLRVWRQVHREHVNAGLLLVGSGGRDMHNCESELRAYVLAHGLESSVQFTGDVHNVEEYLQAADIFAFPTDNEAFGVSLVEALACGLPVVAAATGGVKDIVEHRHNGLLVPAGEFGELHAALVELLSDQALSARLGSAARQTAIDRYSIDSVVEQYGRLFAEVMDQRQIEGE